MRNYLPQTKKSFPSKQFSLSFLYSIYELPHFIDPTAQLYHIHTKRDNQSYYRCPDCYTIAMHPQHYLTHEKEKARYLSHNNDVNDLGYQKFVQPVIQAVTTHTQSHHHGLDYGGRYRTSHY